VFQTILWEDHCNFHEGWWITVKYPVSLARRSLVAGIIYSLSDWMFNGEIPNIPNGSQMRTIETMGNWNGKRPRTVSPDALNWVRKAETLVVGVGRKLWWRREVSQSSRTNEEITPSRFWISERFLSDPPRFSGWDSLRGLSTFDNILTAVQLMSRFAERWWRPFTNPVCARRFCTRPTF
jgi:hypothetical protein